MSSTKFWFTRKKRTDNKSNQSKNEPINKTFEFLFKKGGKNGQRKTTTNK